MSAPIPGDDMGPTDPGGPKHADSTDLGGLDPNKVLRRLSPDRVEAWSLAIIQLQHESGLETTRIKDRAATRKRRDRFRMAFIVFLFVLIFAEGVYAVWQSAHSGGWDTMKDWFSVASVPLTVAAAVAAAFWYPNREAD